MPSGPRPARRSARKWLTPLGTASVLATFLLLASASIAAAAPNPKANIPMRQLPAACTSAPTGATCTNAVVVALDKARAKLGLGAYALPVDFDALSGEQQLFILSNLDRIAYGLPPIRGLSPTLAPAAASAMTADVDPDPTSLLSGLTTYAWTANWAGEWPNAADAYYEWMYDDGYDAGETSNIDCTSATASGCWVHRRNVLSLAEAGTLSMGASVGIDAQGHSSYTMTLVWTPSTKWTSYDYTWAQARAAGAGSSTAASSAVNAVERRIRSKHHRRR